MVDATMMEFSHATVVSFLDSNRFQYSPYTGWWNWTGTHWTNSDDSAIAAHIMSTIASIKSQFDDAPADLAAKGRAFYKTSNAMVTACMNLSKLTPRMVNLELGTGLPTWFINTLDGVIDLRTGKILPHSPQYNMTGIIEANYTPGVYSKRWMDFLESSIPNPDIRGYLQRALGYALTGAREHENMLLFIGTGRNGKGVITQTLNDLLGEQAITSEPGVFQRSSSSRFQVARMARARYVFVNELNTRNTGEETEMMKAATGGDPITADIKYKEPFEFVPGFTIVISTNERPSFPSDDLAFWQRMRVIPFTESFMGREDITLKQDLLCEENRNGILSWLVDGALQVTSQERHIEYIPEIIKSITEETRWLADSLYMFTTEVLEEALELWVPTRTLYRIYCEWCKEAGQRPLSRLSFLDRLPTYIPAVPKQLGEKYGRQRVVSGIKLSDSAKEIYEVD